MTHRMTAVLPLRDAAQLVRDRQEGLAAWRADVEAKLALEVPAGVDRAQQVDARRQHAALERVHTAVTECLGHRMRIVPGGDRDEHPRAVVAHRSDWLRARLAEEFADLGVDVVGEGEDGAEAVAMTVVEQPDLLLIEDRLPWLTGVEVVQAVREFAPRTAVAVQLEDAAGADALVAAGASAVFSRSVQPAQVCLACIDLLVAESLARPA